MEFYLTNYYETLEDFLNDKVLSGKIDKIEKKPLKGEIVLLIKSKKEEEE